MEGNELSNQSVMSHLCQCGHSWVAHGQDECLGLWCNCDSYYEVSLEQENS